MSTPNQNQINRVSLVLEQAGIKPNNARTVENIISAVRATEKQITLNPNQFYNTLFNTIGRIITVAQSEFINPIKGTNYGEFAVSERDAFIVNEIASVLDTDFSKKVWPNVLPIQTEYVGNAPILKTIPLTINSNILKFAFLNVTELDELLSDLMRAMKNAYTDFEIGYEFAQFPNTVKKYDDTGALVDNPTQIIIISKDLKPKAGDLVDNMGKAQEVLRLIKTAMKKFFTPNRRYNGLGYKRQAGDSTDRFGTLHVLNNSEHSAFLEIQGQGNLYNIEQSGYAGRGLKVDSISELNFADYDATQENVILYAYETFAVLKVLKWYIPTEQTWAGAVNSQDKFIHFSMSVTAIIGKQAIKVVWEDGEPTDKTINAKITNDEQSPVPTTPMQQQTDGVFKKVDLASNDPAQPKGLQARVNNKVGDEVPTAINAVNQQGPMGAGRTLPVNIVSADEKGTFEEIGEKIDNFVKPKAKR